VKQKFAYAGHVLLMGSIVLMLYWFWRGSLMGREQEADQEELG